MERKLINQRKQVRTRENKNERSNDERNNETTNGITKARKK